MEGCDKSSTPPPLTNVSTVFSEASIAELQPFDRKFEPVATATRQRFDPRPQCNNDGHASSSARGRYRPHRSKILSTDFRSKTLYFLDALDGPYLLINIIGFMAFWIPEQAESVTIGVTSLLCALALCETV
eukprot:scaffold574_cov190-Amphora_coffeaeformis.AAC.15